MLNLIGEKLQRAHCELLFWWINDVVVALSVMRNYDL